MVSTRKPTASGSGLAQRWDSKEEAKSADTDSQDRTRKGKYRLEKEAQLENKTKKKGNEVRKRESNIRGKCTLLAAERVQQSG